MFFYLLNIVLTYLILIFFSTCLIYRVFVAGVDNGMVVVKPVKNVNDLETQKINTGSNISCIRQVLTLDKFATGGNENPMKIWDLETGKIEFTAKRVSLNY